MDLHSSYPYWLLNEGIIKTYPSLDKNISADIVVLGAGISGALVAWHLCKAGFNVTVIDKRHVGTGSTAASTALLQYEIDTPLSELIEKVGEPNAVKSYQWCLQSIEELAGICYKLPGDCGFRYRPSLQFASVKNDVDDLKNEYRLRKKAGIKLSLLAPEEIKEKFGFERAGALFSKMGAEVDAYTLTHGLLANCKRDGIRIFDKTAVTRIEHEKNRVILVTDSGKKITAKKLIIACGYESQKYLTQKVEQLQSTYAIVSEPVQKEQLWFKRSLIWETKRPYIYLRTTTDNRILIGGKDDDFSNPLKRKKALPLKVKQLEKAFKNLFPKTGFKTDYAWAGTFASTKDGLPFIGSIRQRPNTFFALGFGGNGITFSLIAAQIIRDRLTGMSNKDETIFSFDR